MNGTGIEGGTDGGLTGRAINAVYRAIAQRCASTSAEYSVTATCLEIYNEQVRHITLATLLPEAARTRQHPPACRSSWPPHRRAILRSESTHAVLVAVKAEAATGSAWPPGVCRSLTC